MTTNTLTRPSTTTDYRPEVARAAAILRARGPQHVPVPKTLKTIASIARGSR